MNVNGRELPIEQAGCIRAFSSHVIYLFQGQSAKFVFISFTSSDPENLPRHKSWFFSRNRLNVAVSRSESIVIVIFNPNLLLTSCKKIDEMELLNNFCKLTKFKTIL